jgi:hypothetical protein
MSQEYPEHDKLDTVKEQSQFLGEFLEWCNEKEMFLAKYMENSHYALPVSKSINTLLAEFLRIDLVKLEAEKKKMLQSIRNK